MFLWRDSFQCVYRRFYVVQSHSIFNWYRWCCRYLHAICNTQNVAKETSGMGLAHVHSFNPLDKNLSVDLILSGNEDWSGLHIDKIMHPKISPNACMFHCGYLYRRKTNFNWHLNSKWKRSTAVHSKLKWLKISISFIHEGLMATVNERKIPISWLPTMRR